MSQEGCRLELFLFFWRNDVFMYLDWYFLGGHRITKGDYLACLFVRTFGPIDICFVCDLRCRKIRCATRIGTQCRRSQTHSGAKILRIPKCERWIRTPNHSPANRQRGEFAISGPKQTKAGDRMSKQAKRSSDQAESFQIRWKAGWWMGGIIKTRRERQTPNLRNFHEIGPKMANAVQIRSKKVRIWRKAGLGREIIKAEEQDKIQSSGTSGKFYRSRSMQAKSSSKHAKACQGWWKSGQSRSKQAKSSWKAGSSREKAGQ